MRMLGHSGDEGEDDHERRCPSCRERVPDGADACTMCGRRLAEQRDAPFVSGEGTDRVRTGRLER